MHARFASLAVLALGLAAAGCTSFATVRSARVHPGASVTLQGSLSSPPGDEAGWFWSLDCSVDCSHSVVALDASWTYGWAGEKPYSLGLGVNGFLFPYVEGYAQLNGDTAHAFGVGARIGLPLIGWSNHQVYARYDLPLASGTRVLINPGLFLHAGNSPNGQNPGHFLAFVQGVGVEHRGERRTVVPAVALIVGRGERDSYGQGDGPFTTVFGTASLSVTFHRRRPAPPGP
jgi:hypothetical protein